MRNHFLLSRLWFLVSLLVFMLSEAILPKERALQGIYSVRVTVFFGRTLMYVVTMTRLFLRRLAFFFEWLDRLTPKIGTFGWPVSLRMHVEEWKRLSQTQSVLHFWMHSSAEVPAQCDGTWQFSVLAAAA